MNALTINLDGTTNEFTIHNSTELGDFIIYLKERYGKIEVSSKDKYQYIFKINAN